jgi:hypothetical protein
MSERTFGRVFGALFIGGVVLTVLGLTGVLPQSVITVIVLVLAGGMMLLFGILGGPRAMTAVLVVMLVALLGVVPSFAPERANGAFYGTAAQVIPVLLLVLALEVRLFRIRWVPPLKRHANESWLSHQWRRFDRAPASFPTAVVLSVTLVVLVAGEIQAINAVASQNPEHKNPGGVYTAVVVGLIVVAFVALFGGPQRGEPDDKSI